MDYLKLEKPFKPPVDWNQIKLVIFDCDGVLTDGRIVYGNYDTLCVADTKNFNAHDGMGFTLLHYAGITPAVITGRSSLALSKRCKDLKIKHLYQGVQHKLEKANKLLAKLGLSWNQVAYMGDDWNDIPCMQAAAVSFCPVDACQEIRHLADVVTTLQAGRGAVRECIDHILYCQHRFEQAVRAYLSDISIV